MVDVAGSVFSRSKDEGMCLILTAGYGLETNMYIGAVMCAKELKGSGSVLVPSSCWKC